MKALPSHLGEERRTMEDDAPQGALGGLGLGAWQASQLSRGPR